jgi:hypothetical protein
MSLLIYRVQRYNLFKIIQAFFYFFSPVDLPEGDSRFSLENPEDDPGSEMVDFVWNIPD